LEDALASVVVEWCCWMTETLLVSVVAVTATCAQCVSECVCERVLDAAMMGGCETDGSSGADVTERRRC
jgi:hypothetical protein